jgi:uncharacterized protein (TIGR02284 family)
MDKETQDHIESLHTRAIDACNGYEEALEDAEGRGLTPLFREMIALHTHNADELAAELANNGQASSGGGSFMSTIHRTIMSIRSLFGGLDESILPGLIDGETRNLSRYDDALAAPALPADMRSLLQRQRDRIEAAVTRMQAAKA